MAMKGKLLASTAFEASSRTSAELAAFNPPKVSADAALLERREDVDARLRHLERNSGLMQAAVARKRDNVVGPDMRPKIMPNWRVLGITPEQARELGRQIEAWWEVHANDPDKMMDAGRRMSFGMMARVLYWHWLVDGRTACVPLWRPRYGALSSTAFMLIDPWRVSNPDGLPNSRFLKNGVELNRYGEATAYHVRERNPGELHMDADGGFRWERIPAYTRWGRRRFIMGFEQTQAEQTQGRSPFLPVLKKLRMLEKRDDLELQAAANFATMALYIKSDLPSDAVFNMMSQAPTGDETSPAEQVAEVMAFTADYYRRNSYLVNGTQVSHLLPGEEIGSVKGERGGESFVAGQQQWMRYVGWALGLTYEQISGDFSKSSYVGIRAGFNEAWKATLADRMVFADTALTPMVDLWLEEQIGIGRIELPAGAPSYEDARAAYLQIRWVGPGMGSVDPLKEATARRTNMQMGYTTLEQELDENGVDPEDHIAQIGNEEAWRREHGLPSIFALSTRRDAPVDAPEDDEDEGVRPGAQE